MTDAKLTFTGLSGDQRFIPGFAFPDENMRVVHEGQWWIVDDETREMRLDPEAPKP